MKPAFASGPGIATITFEDESPVPGGVLVATDAEAVITAGTYKFAAGGPTIATDKR